MKYFTLLPLIILLAACQSTPVAPDGCECSPGSSGCECSAELHAAVSTLRKQAEAQEKKERATQEKKDLELAFAEMKRRGDQALEDTMRDMYLGDLKSYHEQRDAAFKAANFQRIESLPEDKQLAELDRLKRFESLWASMKPQPFIIPR